MSVRNSDLCTPSKIFWAPQVAPILESVSDSCSEFAARTADAIRAGEEVLRARCAYNKRVAEAAKLPTWGLRQRPGKQAP
jgi:hypothetical protein